MSYFSAPISSGDALDLEQRFEFLGWHSQIAAEITQLLEGRSAPWLLAVASQIDTVLGRQWSELSREDLEVATSLAQSERGGPAVHPDDVPGLIHTFAALEPLFSWPKFKDPHVSRRWERYAVFALWTLHEAAKHLPRKTDPIDPLTTLLQVDLAASQTIEAMRALQIAQSLRHQAVVESEKKRQIAIAAHASKRLIHTRALALATAKPFPTLQAAAQHVADNLPKNKEGSEYFQVDTVKGWLRAAKWKPTKL